MKKIVIQTFIFVFAFALDKNPQKITQEDLKIVKNIETRAYNTIERNNKKILNISKIYTYIIRNKAYKIQEERLKVSLNTDVGYKRNRAYISLNYNILDKKQKRDIELKKIQDRSSILQNIQNYAKLQQNLFNLQKQLKFARLKYRLIKTQVYAAVEYREQLFKQLENIQNIKEKIQETKINIVKQRLQLLNYVKIEYREKLENMLK